MNKLYVGDNLSVMRSLQPESIDLVATDGPFFSQQNYGDFDDRWKSMDDYLHFMVERCKECYRLLKPTGSFYLHCNQSASHYLKVELDKVFGIKNFRNEIIWCYNKWSNKSKSFQKNHDIILAYSKSDNYIFNAVYGDFSDATKKSRQKGYHINYKDNYLLVYDDSKPKAIKLINSGKFDKVYYENGNPGVLMSDFWTDIKYLASASKERNGYSTQKPISISQRIIKSSSNPGDVVLDPFAGSGTTLDAAQSLGRKWIGIEKNKDAIPIIENRLKDNHGMLVQYEVIHGN